MTGRLEVQNQPKSMTTLPSGFAPNLAARLLLMCAINSSVHVPIGNVPSRAD